MKVIVNIIIAINLTIVFGQHSSQAPNFYLPRRRYVRGLPFDNTLVYELVVLNNTVCLYKSTLPSNSSEDFSSEEFPCKKEAHPMTVLEKEGVGIFEIEEDALRNCIYLETIKLSGNKLETLKPQTFKKNIELYELDLSYNNLKFLPPNIFQFNKKLAIVSLKHNVLYALEEYSFAYTSITTLYLQDNFLTTWDVNKLLCNAPNLELYGFNGNFIPCSSLNNIFRLMNLYQIKVMHKTEVEWTSEMARVKMGINDYFCVPDMCNQ